MRSRGTPRFWSAYRELPAEVRESARRAYAIFRVNPEHPGLRFKRVHEEEPVYSVRIGRAYRALGLFEGDVFDPREWKPQTPTTAYLELRDDDAFWAARRVMAFSDGLIRAAVATGRYSDTAASDHLAAVLIKRRDTIGRIYLTAINPIVNPRLDAAGALTFDAIPASL